MDSLDNDILIRFASYLCSKDIVSLALTCRRFGSSHLHDTGSSLMEDTALQMINNSQKDEREALPKLADQSYIELYNELEQLRAPRIFDQVIGNGIIYFDINKNDKSCIKCSTQLKSTAISNHVMRAGRHYATFTSKGNRSVNIGIVRPIKNWDKKGLDRFNPSDEEHYHTMLKERTEGWRESNVHYCSLTISTRPGSCFLTDWYRWRFHDWDGSEGFEISDKIGMLLDLDAGTLSIYKNGRRLGIMKDEIMGEDCWVATLSTPGDQVRIEMGAIPI